MTPKCPSLMSVSLQLILQTLKALGDREITRETVEDDCRNPLRLHFSDTRHNCNTNHSTQQVSHSDHSHLEIYLTPFSPLDIS